MTARVQIQIEAVDAASGVLRAITSQFGQLGTVASDFGDVIKTVGKEVSLYDKLMAGGKVSVEEMAKATEMANAAQARFAEQALMMVIEGVKESIAVTQEYAQQVRDLSTISGESTEETSRMIQVLDDYQLTAQDAETATRILTKNGYAPTIETLAQLSDQYLQINDAQERNKFIIDNLGRSGMQWVNLLKQGGAALREQSAAIDENLILTSDAVQSAEDYRLALDAWNDSVMGVKIAIGSHLLPVLTELIDAEARAAAQEERWNIARIEGGNMSRASAGIEAEHNRVVEEASRVADSATRSYEAWAQVMSNTNTVAIEDTAVFKEQLKGLNDILDGDLGKSQDAYNAKMAEYNRQLAEARSQKERDEINANIAAETEAYNQRALSIMFNIQQEAILNSQMPSEAKLQMITALGQSYGFYDEQTAAAIDTTNGWIARVEDGTLSVEAATQWMKDFGKSTNATKNTIPGFDEQMQHLTGRSEDAAIKLLEAKEAQAALASGINSESGPAVHYLTAGLADLPPSYSAWYYDIYIATHRTGGSATFTAPDISSGQGYQTGVHVGEGSGRQVGGSVYAMNPYMVGERGAEPFIPSVNGRILGHAEALHAATVSGGNGGGAFGPFYGNVTIETNENSVASIMSMR